jgi:stage III sporulation protein AG
MGHDEQQDRQWLKKLFHKKGAEKGKFSFQYVIVILCIGLMLMIVGNLLSPNDDQGDTAPVFQEDDTDRQEDQETFGQRSSSQSSEMEQYEIQYENQIKESLEQIVGISDVTVMINLAETERMVYEKNSSTKQQKTDETDREGGTRKVDDVSRDEEVVIVREGDQEKPLLVQKEKPQVRGVLIVAEGVENAQVKGMVVEAVSRVLDVPAHRVSVMPKKSKEE